MDATHTTNNELTHLRLPSESLKITTHPCPFTRSRFRDQMMFCAYMGDKLDWRTRLKAFLRVYWQLLLQAGR